MLLTGQVNPYHVVEVVTAVPIILLRVEFMIVVVTRASWT